MDTLGYLSSLESPLMGSWRRRSTQALYKRDPEAWLWDVLGYRWHEKQREIVENFLHSRRNAVKSANGTGKTRIFGELAVWGVAVHEPGELLIIASSPSKTQLQDGLFGYVDKNINRMRSRGFEIPGYITDSSVWAYRTDRTAKAKTLMRGRTPPRQDIVGTFQGIRAVADTDTATWVMIDEGGAVHDDLYAASEAVTTGAGDNKICVIGNPDRIGTYFQRIFEDPELSKTWATSTIAATDLPTFTGEKVYDDPEMQRMMLESGMIDRAWVEQAKIAWGEASARYKSKVLGEFPDGDDWSFFSMLAINAAENTIVLPDREAGPRILGVDLADGGDDDSKAYLNEPGFVFEKPEDGEPEPEPEDRIGSRIRHRETWNEGRESANRIHKRALDESVEIVVMDRLGVGAGPYNQVAARSDRYYTVVGAMASGRSPDPTRWANARAYWYDVFREACLEGIVDLDFSEEDGGGVKVGKAIRDQMLSVRYDFNNRGAVLLESKKDARKRGVHSPDDLDAVIFSYAVQAQKLLEDPVARADPGDVFLEDPWSDESLDSMMGMPI